MLVAAVWRAVPGTARTAAGEEPFAHPQDVSRLAGSEELRQNGVDLEWVSVLVLVFFTADAPECGWRPGPTKRAGS